MFQNFRRARCHLYRLNTKSNAVYAINPQPIVASSSYPATLRYIVAAVNACHRAGLTVEQLDAGEVRLVRTAE